MKKLKLFISIFFLLTANLFAQQGINYKAVISNNGVTVQNQSIQVQFTILENGITNVYQESHNPTTDANGIVVLSIGDGTLISGNFNNISWSNQQFLKVAIDSGNGWTDMGTTAFGFVPYSKQANNSEKLETKSLATIKAEIKAELNTEKFDALLARLDAIETKLNNISVNSPVNLNAIVSDISNLQLSVAANYHDLREPGGYVDYRFTPLEEKTADMSIETVWGYRTVRFTHVNLQVVNGAGTTSTSTNGLINGSGLGNIIVGYNELRDNTSDNRTGYHNLIVGVKNNYRSYGGVVFGVYNGANAPYSTVTGGRSNEANGEQSSVSGGYNRTTNLGDSWRAGDLIQTN